MWRRRHPRSWHSADIEALATGETVVFPDDASSAAGSVYLSDPVKLEQMLAS